MAKRKRIKDQPSTPIRGGAGVDAVVTVPLFESANAIALTQGGIVILRQLLEMPAWANSVPLLRSGARLLKSLPKIEDLPANVQEQAKWGSVTFNLRLGDEELRTGAAVLRHFVKLGVFGATEHVACLFEAFGVTGE